MIEQILEFLDHAGVAISLFAVAVIICSFIIATWRYAKQFQIDDRSQNFGRFKKELGSGLLLGLEILVLADVIETMTAPPNFSITLDTRVYCRYPYGGKLDTHP